MNFYSIKDLEVYSGIKAHTIRIWEKRYNLLEPSRTDSNIRYYDDHQLIKLLNIATLLESGWKISNISRLDRNRLMTETEKCLHKHSDHTYAIPINGMIAGMFSFDETGIRKIIDSCFRRLGIGVTFKEIIYPLLHRIGMMWRTEEISPAQEHFISAIIRQKILVELDKLPVQAWDAQRGVVLFLPQEEYHEIGLLVTAYLLRNQHIPVVLLGSNTPVTVVQNAVNKLEPAFLITFLITQRKQQEVQVYIDTLAEAFPSQKIGVACIQDLLNDIQIPENVLPLHDPDDLKKLIKQNPA